MNYRSQLMDTNRIPCFCTLYNSESMASKILQPLGEITTIAELNYMISEQSAFINSTNSYTDIINKFEFEINLFYLQAVSEFFQELLLNKKTAELFNMMRCPYNTNVICYLELINILRYTDYKVNADEDINKFLELSKKGEFYNIYMHFSQYYRYKNNNISL